MPKRSTEFQRLVYLANKHSAVGSTVTESKPLRDSKGKEREVDVCIESSIGGIPVTIGIECNERNRKASVKWVEEMKGKHDDLPTNLLILYSRSGFTKGAKEKAETYKMNKVKQIVALETLDENSAGRLFNGANLLVWKTSSQKVTQIVVALADDNKFFAKEETFDFPAKNTIAVYNGSGDEIGNLLDLANHILHRPTVVYRCLQISEDKHKNFTVRSESVRDKDNNPIFLKFRTFLRRIEYITITGEVAVKTSPLPLQHGKLEDKIVAWGTVGHQGKQAMIVVSKDNTGIEKASFATDDITVELQKGPPPEESTGSPESVKPDNS